MPEYKPTLAPRQKKVHPPHPPAFLCGKRQKKVSNTARMEIHPCVVQVDPSLGGDTVWKVEEQLHISVPPPL